jgi:NADH:ubiquinone reductase (non-electrogenic)
MQPSSVLSRIVVLGTGFASFSFARTIDLRRYDVTVVSPRNHFLFTPLLPSTTVGTIEFRSIIEPFRVARPGIRFVQAHARSLDHVRHTLRCDAGAEFDLPYDILVIGVGAVSNTYGVPGVSEHTLFLKELADARLIRERIINTLERASRPGITPEERSRLLHFVIVGGGPTGVEFAAELHDLITEDLSTPYKDVIRDARITLLEAGEHILNTFDATLSKYATEHFRRQNIEVRAHSPVTRVEERRMILKDGTSLEFGLAVWSTGIGPTDFVSSIELPKDRAQRILTDGHLQAKGMKDIFAIGDCATIEDVHQPATAQVAQQKGTYLARELNARARGRSARPFAYRHFGMLAYIGSARALADLEPIKGKGFSTFLFWRSAYVTKLVSMRNRILVLFDWFKSLLFGRDISRI